MQKTKSSVDKAQSPHHSLHTLFFLTTSSDSKIYLQESDLRPAFSFYFGLLAATVAVAATVAAATLWHNIEVDVGQVVGTIKHSHATHHRSFVFGE